ncbi:MAG: type IX secretion system membrane protein PorP/SprF [Fluviicola sp.]|nr:type IX secretion system membrane protein PorP/SprF [Fluviicola sp.]
MKNLVLTILCLNALTAFSQQLGSYSHHSFNTLVVNPAYAGSREALSITTLSRAQWVGFKGAPITNTLTAHMPLRNNSMGLGLSFVNDKIGPVNSTSVSIDYAYRIRFNSESGLSFGLKSTAQFTQINLNDLVAIDANDNMVTGSVRSQFNPNFGLGAFYSNNKFYVGVSSPLLLQHDLEVQNITTSQALMKRHFFINTGTVIKLNSHYSFKPSIQLKMVSGAAPQADFSAIFTIPANFELGMTYRTNDAIGFLAGIIVNNRFRIGYGFDFSTNVRTGMNNSGTHELLLRYELTNRGKNAIVSPRNF